MLIPIINIKLKAIILFYSIHIVHRYVHIYVDIERCLIT